MVSDEGFGEIFQKNENRVIRRFGGEGIGGVFDTDLSQRRRNQAPKSPPGVEVIEVLPPGFTTVSHHNRISSHPPNRATAPKSNARISLLLNPVFFRIGRLSGRFPRNNVTFRTPRNPTPAESHSQNGVLVGRTYTDISQPTTAATFRSRILPRTPLTLDIET